MRYQVFFTDESGRGSIEECGTWFDMQDAIKNLRGVGCYDISAYQLDDF